MTDLMEVDIHQAELMEGEGCLTQIRDRRVGGKSSGSEPWVPVNNCQS